MVVCPQGIQIFTHTAPAACIDSKAMKSVQFLVFASGHKISIYITNHFQSLFIGFGFSIYAFRFLVFGFPVFEFSMQ